MEEFSPGRYQMLEKFQWMLVVRMLAAVFVFIIYFFVKKMNVFSFPFLPFTVCCGLEAFVNQPYPFIIRRVRSLNLLAYIYLIADLVLISAIIHFLGGIEFAFFSVAYPIIIVLAGIMLSRVACYAVAFLSSIVYGTMVAVEYFGFLPHIPLFGFRLDGLHQMGIVCANILFFYFVAFLCGYSTDLIEERTQKLEREKKFSENIINTMLDGLLVFDLGGKIKELNAAVMKISGYNREQLIGLNLADRLFDEESGGKFNKATKAIRAGGEIRDMEVKLITSDKREVPISVNASAVEPGGGEQGSVVAILRDISKEKMMDKLKTEFVSNVTHELLTPLTSIGGFVTMIIEGKVGRIEEQQKEFLEIVRKQTKYLKAMIESMLDFSRMETGRLDLYPEPLQVEDIVREIVADFQPQVMEKEIQVSVCAEQNLPKVLADRVRLGRAFSNIFGNAVKFTPRGRSVVVDVKQQRGFISVCVTDEGIGLARVNLEKVFERFFQVDSAMTRVVGGAGMGLAIAREIVEKHGGAICAESEGIGRGSKFTFTLPVA